MSNRTQPGRDGVDVNMLDEVIGTYRENIQRQVYDLSIAQPQRIEPEWDAIIREASVSAMDDFFRAPIINGRVAARRFTWDKFSYHLRSLTREELKRRHNNRRQQFVRFSAGDREGTRREISASYAEQDSSFRRNIEVRRALVEVLEAKFPKQAERPAKFLDIPSGKTLILPSVGGRLAWPASRRASIDETAAELEETRKASHLQSIAALTTMEMKLAAIEGNAEEPRWIYELARLAQGGTLPHQDILDSAPAQTRPWTAEELVEPPAQPGPPTKRPASPIPADMQR
jgi:hypothetical protein